MRILANAGTKKSRLIYYLEFALSLGTPRGSALERARRIWLGLNEEQRAQVEARVAYYNRLDAPFRPSDQAEPARLNWRARQRNYHMDFHTYARHFPSSARFDRVFGDVRALPGVPSLIKARPIEGDHRNAVLFNLNRIRHFVFVQDATPFRRKRGRLVWRGGGWQASRRSFLERFHAHPRCDVGHASKRRNRDEPWRKPYRSIHDQLQDRYILSLEGNDVATNLKWILSSNSLCFMPKPRMESWFMEGTLEPGRHYVELQPDCADLEEKIDQYERNPDAAESIIHNAQSHVAQFRDPDLELLISLLVMEKYLLLSGQIPASTIRSA